MKLYLLVPELLEIHGGGTDLIGGHFDDLALYESREKADLEAHKQNKFSADQVTKMVVIEMEVE